MASGSRRRRRAPRRADQEKLLTARMSSAERDLVKSLARERGLSVAAYVLQLARADARSVSMFGRSVAATVTGDNSTTAEGPRRDEAPHAKAGRAVSAAAG